MKRRLLSLLLVLVMVLGMLPTVALAAPAESNGVYQIGTAEELLWFAQQVNGGNTKISGVLTADIDLSEVTNWPGIGIHKSRFAGSFDGQSHTVTFSDAMWGLFGFVKGSDFVAGASTYPVVTIQNVITAGSVRRSAIVHNATNTHIIGCINRATVYNPKESYMGGILGNSSYNYQGTTYQNDVLIQNCGNEASVTGDDYIGGIIGEMCYVGTRVVGCYNTGNIHGSENVGGITGYAQNYKGDCIIKDSYNTGRVTGTSHVAGLAGCLYTNMKVQNCYNAGPTTYAIAGHFYNNSNTISNTYFLGVNSAKSVPDYVYYETAETTTRATAKTKVDMSSQEFAELLGSAFQQSCPTPVLSWQEATTHTGSPCENCGLGSEEKETYDVSFQTHDGYVLNGEDHATQGATYSFTLQIHEDSYRTNYNFAVKVNGQNVKAASDGRYYVLNVSGPISVTVTGVEIIPGSFSIKLPGTGNGYRISGDTTVKLNEDYSMTVTFVDGFQAGDDFKVIAQEIVPEDQLPENKPPEEGDDASGAEPFQPEEIELKLKDGKYILSNVQKNYRILVSGVEVVSKGVTATVNFTVTEGFQVFHEPNDSGEVMIDRSLQVPYFDLSLYGLEKYYYNPYCYLDEDGNIRSIQQKGTPESAYDNITVMHAFIVATELYYLGYDQDEVGTGISYQEDPEAFRKAISWSQDAGSSFMDFWDHGTNLNYYVNYAYPLAYPGWGSTSDQEVIKNGDVISVHLITGQGSGSNFGFFTVNDTNSKFDPGKDVVNEVTVEQGEKVKLTYFWTATTGNYDTRYVTKGNQQLYWIHADDLGSNAANVERTWSTKGFGSNKLNTNAKGEITVDTATLEPGTYYIGALGGFTSGGGKDNAGFVSSGSEAGATFFRLTVEECTAKLGDVTGDNQINIMDALYIQRYLASRVTSINEALADVTGDGTINVMDALTIRRYLTGKITIFPAEQK